MQSMNAQPAPGGQHHQPQPAPPPQQAVPAPAGPGNRVLPAFEASGVIPPFVGEAAAAAGRSPYRATLAEVLNHFGTSGPRLIILDGLLRLRRDLHVHGFVSGWQWLDGSFVESLSGREPTDIDVVTFFDQPVGQALGNAQLPVDMIGANAKGPYSCDAYYVDLAIADPRGLVEQTAYWFGLFSHRRGTFQWKGIVEIDLAPTEDQAAAALLANLQGGVI